MSESRVTLDNNMRVELEKNPVYKTYIERLITPEIERLSQAVLDNLRAKIPPIVVNPSRKKEKTFNELPPDVQKLMAINLALDIRNSQAYNESIKSQVNDATTQNIDKQQQEAGQIKHIKEQGKVAYHIIFHPIESAAVIGELTKILLIGKISVPQLSVLATRAKTIFTHHDRIQNLDEANKKSNYAAGKITGLNEIETAAAFAEERRQYYQNEIDKLNQEKHAAQIKKLQQALDLVDYEAWKFIVPGTTMLKSVDGQPTLNTVQVISLEEKLSFTPEQRSEFNISQEELDAIKNNYATAISIAASAVDSHFPAMLTLIKNHLEMGSKLPIDLMKSGVVTLPPNLKEKIFKNQTDDAINQTALFFGQNIRMFSELNESWSGALTKVFGSQDGVALWNDALRLGNTEELQKILTIKTTQEFTPFGSETPINKNSTLFDVFIHRLQGEIDFAIGQGPELLIAAAEKAGLNLPDVIIDVTAWKRHAESLQHLMKQYNAAQPDEKLQIATALFQIAANQPGLHLNNQALLKNIQTAEKELEEEVEKLAEKKHALIERQSALQKELEQLNISSQPEKANQSHAISSSENSTAQMMKSTIKSSAAGVVASLKETKQAQLAKIEDQLQIIATTAPQLQKEKENLKKVKDALIARGKKAEHILTVQPPSLIKVNQRL